MAAERIGLGNYLGLAVVVALNLALFRGVESMLTIPAISILLILLDVVLARLLIWRRPLQPSDCGFIVTGFVATLLTFPYNNDPQILQRMLWLYHDLTGDMRIFRYSNTSSFLYAERATLVVAILAVALAGGTMAGWGSRRLSRRHDDRSERANSLDI